MRILLTLLIFISLGAADDYYQKLDNLLGTAVGVMAQANALPIITGALDESRKAQGADKQYYDTASRLADNKHNYAWRAYQNSRKQSIIYTSEKANDISKAESGSGAVAEFIDQVSGQKYKQAEDNYGRNIFVKNFRKGTGSTDIYIENIGVPASKLLEDLFEVELPELPENSQALPKLNVPSLEKFQDKIERSIKGDESDLRSHWKVILEPLAGKVSNKGKNIYSVPERETVEVGLKIIDPDGAIVKTKEQLGGYVPYVTLLPLPEGELESLQLGAPVSPVEEAAQSKLDKPNGLKLGELDNIRPGEPTAFRYLIGEEIKSVELQINNSKGQPVYTLKESRPDYLNPLPLVWPAVLGDYTVELSGLDRAGQLQATEPELVRVQEKATGETKLKSQRIVNNTQGDFYGTIKLRNLNSTSYGLEKVYVWLYGSEEAGSPFSGSVYFTFARFSPQRSKLYSFEQVGLGQKTQIHVQLVDDGGVPVANAPVSLFSRRNLTREVDHFDRNDLRTDSQGEAHFTFWSQVPGEAEIYALSDLLWLSEPVIVKVGKTKE